MTKHHVLAVALGSLAVAASCTPRGIHTPSNIAGPVALTVANAQGPGQDMCAILMLPAAGPLKVDNLLGKTKLPPGGHAEFSVAPGTYRFAVSNCEISGDQSNAQKGSYMTAIAGKIDPFEVSGPTYVSVGGPPASPPAGYTVKVLATQVLRSAVCSPSNGECNADTNCCSGAPCNAVGRCP